MKKGTFFIFILGIIIQLKAQRILTQFPQVNGTVYAAAVDTVSQTIFIGGDITSVNGIPRTSIAAIDLNTGALKSFSPTLSPASNMQSVSDLLVAGDTLYVCGNFTSVQGNARSYTCAFRISTGTLLPFNPNFNTYPFQMKMYRNKLYFLGTFSSGGYYSFASVNRNTSAFYPFHLIGASNLSTGRVYSFNIKNDKIYALINVNNGWDPFNYFLGVFDLNTGSLADSINCCFDRFSLGIKSDLVAIGNNAISICNIDSIYYSKPGRFATLDTNLNIKSLCHNSFTTSTPYNNGPNHVESWDKVLFMNGSSFSKWGQVNNIKNFAAISQLSGEVIWAPDPKAASISINDFFTFQNRLYLMGTFDTLDNHSCKNFAVYDIRGLSTDSLIKGSDSVCKQSQFNPFHILLPNNLIYNWNYTGSNFIKNQNMNSAYYDFFYNSTQGNITCQISGTCIMDGPGFASKPLYFYPIPSINVGNDSTLTCAVTNISINAIFQNGNTIQWYLPNGTQSGLNPISVDTTGIYAAEVTQFGSGCKYSDSLQIFVDTIKPIIQNINNSYQLLCSPNNIQINAITLSNNDSLWWQSSQLNYIPNPINITMPGNYILHAQNTNNGCLNSQVTNVQSPSQFPVVNLPFLSDTISCIKDSILLDGSANHPFEIIQWIQLSNQDTILDSTFINNNGFYTMLVTDTISKCTSQGQIFIAQNFSQAIPIIPPGNYEINCSIDSLIINGSSLNNLATLYWIKPNGNFSGNPIITSDSGFHILNSVHPNSGCVRKDSILVNQTKKILLSISNDTLVCTNSNVMVRAEPIGNFGSLTYLWNGIPSTNTYTTNIISSTYLNVLVNDNTNCYGKDSVFVKVAPVLVTDSIQTIQPCDINQPNGEINWFVHGGIAPLIYTINNGSPAQSSNTFSQLTFGQYILSVSDSLHCSHSNNAEINTSSVMPSANFLVSSLQFKKDTFALIDLTQPKPDTVQWSFSGQVSIINQDVFNPIIVQLDTGVLQITLTAKTGNCTLSKTKTIYSTERDSSMANLNNENGIKNFSISPNPNAGIFTLSAEFYKKQNACILIYDSNGNRLYKKSLIEVTTVFEEIDLSNTGAGNYYLYFVGEFDSRSETIVIQQ